MQRLNGRCIIESDWLTAKGKLMLECNKESAKLQAIAKDARERGLHDKASAADCYVLLVMLRAKRRETPLEYMRANRPAGWPQ